MQINRNENSGAQKIISSQTETDQKIQDVSASAFPA